MTRMERIKAKYEATKVKAKEKAAKLKENVSTFVSEHPGVIVGIAVVGAGIGIFMRSGNSKPESIYIPPSEDNDYAGMVQSGKSESGDDEEIDFIPAKDESDESRKEALKKLWEEEYKENWDKVYDLANSLDLKYGEMFMIEDSKQYADEPWYDGKPIVSHLVNNKGIYPPDE